MANVDEKVMALVEAELAKNPGTGSSDLFEMAKAKVPSIGELSIRQFHARYPLQVKRRNAAQASEAAPPKKKTAAIRKKAAPKKQKQKQEKQKEEKPAAPPAGRRRRGLLGKRQPQEGREAVRAVLMRFATELASAEEMADVVKVLAGADRYVDEVMEATGS